MDLREAYEAYIAKHGKIISYGDYIKRMVEASVKGKGRCEVKTDESVD